MLNTINYGASGTLAASISESDTEIRVSSPSRFSVPSGDHYYLTLKENGRREVVRVFGSSGDRLQVERGRDNTTAQSFTQKACLAVEWNPAQLREFNQAGSPAAGVVAAGTYCLDCTTCIDINSAGQITAVNGAGGC